MSLDASLALHRFGVGARQGSRGAMPGDARAFLKQQLRQPRDALIEDDDLPSSQAAARALAGARADRRADKDAGRPIEPAGPLPAVLGVAAALASGDPGQIRRSVYQAEVTARLGHGAATESGFVERLALFWTNHFAVSVDKGLVHVLGGAMEREAIRPHVLGAFADLLKAVTRHPAMLVFLDNQQSVGPGSRAGTRGNKGLNENLAREMLELHTLGVSGGYTQADVTALAGALTGWGWVGPKSDRDDAGRFAFFPGRHEPGPATVLGKTYAQDGAAQGEAILDDLARHPATAAHLARKLATHFIADEPPTAIVRRLEEAYLRSGGDLAVVAAALVDSPEAWDPTLRKVKSPYEFVLAAARLEPRLLSDAGMVSRTFAAMGQRTFAPPSPRGWPDEAAAWLAPHAFKERLDWATLVAERFPPTANPSAIAEDVFGPLLSEPTRHEIARAQSGPQGLALLLMSPEFQRR